MAGLVIGQRVVAVERDEGEAIAWDQVVGMVHAQMRSLVGPTRDLEDLSQAALEQLVKSVDRFEGRAALSTFTYRVCVHVALSHWRSWRRWLRRFDLSGSAAIEARLADPRASAPERLLAAQRLRRLQAALEKLSPIKRVTLTLADLEELPASRVAEILQCPEATVRSRLATARRELHEALRRDPLFDGEA